MYNYPTETVCSYLRKLNDLGEPMHHIKLFGDSSGCVHNALGIVEDSHFKGRAEMFAVLERLTKVCPACNRKY